MPKPIIRLNHFSQEFTLTEREAGGLAWVRQLVRPKKKTVTAVADVSFSVQPGEFVGFIGPNGAGKTTTLKVLAGIIHPTRGEVEVMGFNPYERAPEFLRQFAVVLGNKSQLWWDLPARDTFELHRALYEIPKAEYAQRVKELGTLLGVQDLLGVPVRKLSLGQRMKCELALALLHHPNVLLLDEPTIGLDVVSQQSIRQFLRTWNQQRGTTILLTSHYMQDIAELTQRVITIDHGALIYDGPLDDLVRQFVNEKLVRIEFSSEVAPAKLSAYGVVESANSWEASLRVPREQVAEATARILRELPVADVLVEEVPIEDVVRALFSRERGGSVV